MNGELIFGIPRKRETTRNLARIPLLALCLCVSGFLSPPPGKAQNPPPSPRVPSTRNEAPYLVPQTIFVGDPGRLVVPLGQIFSGVETFVLEAPGELPESPDLVIRRIELRHRGGLPQLLVDFIPYAPGLLSFPPLALAPSGDNLVSGEDPFTVTGLQAQVASILTPSQMVLSESAPPLAVPGTSFLVYGTAILILMLLFLGIGGGLWGRRHFGEIWEGLRRRHLLRAMTRFLRRLGQEKDFGKSGKAGYYLSLLSGELREFLSLFTGINCRSLTPGEFFDLPLGYAARGDVAVPALSGGTVIENSAGYPVNSSRPDNSLLHPVFLCRLFKTWDTLRFSGRGIDRIDLLRAFNETGFFIAALDRAEKKRKIIRPVLKPAPAAADTDGRGKNPDETAGGGEYGF